MNVLLVEDQQRLANALAAILREARYSVDVVGDGVSALEYAETKRALGEPYDAVVLDVMLPRKDGFEVMRELRRSGDEVPVIMLTARDTLRDKITGLDAGADDYLTKPFQPAELLARLRALTRRKGAMHVEEIVLGNTHLDLMSGDLSQHFDDDGDANTANAAGSTPARTVHLTQREFEVCKLMLAALGQVFTKAQLLSHVWGADNDADENSVEAYISFLRKKLSFIRSPLKIETLRGVGYRLVDTGTQNGAMPQMSLEDGTKQKEGVPNAR